MTSGISLKDELNANGYYVESLDDIEKTTDYTSHIHIHNKYIFGLPETWGIIEVILAVNRLQTKIGPVVLFAYNDPEIGGENFYVPTQLPVYDSVYEAAETYEKWLVKDRMKLSSCCLGYIEIMDYDLYEKIMVLNEQQ